MNSDQAVVVFGDRFATDLVRVVQDPAEMDSGWWAVLQTYEGQFYGFQFANRARDISELPQFIGGNESIPQMDKWVSNIAQSDYEHGVEIVRESIAAGWVYQTNYCRILRQKLESKFNLSLIHI